MRIKIISGLLILMSFSGYASDIYGAGVSLGAVTINFESSRVNFLFANFNPCLIMGEQGVFIINANYGFVFDMNETINNETTPLNNNSFGSTLIWGSIIGGGFLIPFQASRMEPANLHFLIGGGLHLDMIISLDDADLFYSFIGIGGIFQLLYSITEDMMLKVGVNGSYDFFRAAFPF